MPTASSDSAKTLCPRSPHGATQMRLPLSLYGLQNTLAIQYANPLFMGLRKPSTDHPYSLLRDPYYIPIKEVLLLQFLTSQPDNPRLPLPSHKKATISTPSPLPSSSLPHLLFCISILISHTHSHSLSLSLSLSLSSTISISNPSLKKSPLFKLTRIPLLSILTISITRSLITITHHHLIN